MVLAVFVTAKTKQDDILETSSEQNRSRTLSAPKGATEARRECYEGCWILCKAKIPVQ